MRKRRIIEDYLLVFSLDGQYPIDGSKVKVYLLQVRTSRWLLILRFLKRLLLIIGKLILSGILISPLAKIATTYAYLERGYEAIGGEYLFILLIYWGAYKGVGYLLNI